MELMVRKCYGSFIKFTDDYFLFFHQNISDDTDSVQSPAATSDSHLDLPEWLVCGESVILRQSNYSGIIAFIGNTEFATGLWIGVELDAPLGENLKYT